MAILFITHKFPPSIGGMQKQSYELINGMRKREKVFTIIQSPVESKLLFFIKLKRRIKSMLSKHPEITTVHCNDGTVASSCLWLLRKKSIYLTATIHGLDVSFPSRMFQKYIVPKLRQFDRVFAVSEATAGECYERGFRKEQIITIKNGVDHAMALEDADPNFASEFKSKYGVDLLDEKVLLSIGRPVKRKGFLWFAKTVLPKLGEDYKYLVVGPGNPSKLTSTFLRLLPDNIAHQIKLAFGYPDDAIALRSISSAKFLYLDQMPYKDLVQLIIHSKLVLMPNIKVDGDMEGFGLVALEAALRKTFVLASDLEGITCAIEHNRNGYLLSPGVSEPWIDTINSLFENEIAVKAKGETAQQYVLKNYSWDKMIDEYYNEFQQLVDSKKEKRSIPEFAIA